MKIRLSENFRAVFYAPFYATLSQGFFAREGVDVELVDSSVPGAATTGLIDGSIDVTWGGPMRVMKARNEANGPQVVCFCEVVWKDPFYLVGRRRGTFQLTDLSTVRFASVSEVPTPWLCLQHDLREIGIDPAELNRIPDRSMADNLEALRRGEIDVAQLFEPYVSQAVAQGAGEILHAQSGRGPTSYTTFLATRDSVRKNRAAFAAMTHAIGQMQVWLASARPEELAASVQAYFPAIPQATLADAFARYKAAGLWATDTAISRTGFARLADSLQSGGFIAKKPPYDDCVVDFSDDR